MSGITVTYEEAAAAFDSTKGQTLPDIGRSMITSEQLAELKRLEQAATKGPWTFLGHKEYDIARILQLEVSHEDGLGDGWVDADDAAFITATRNLMPELLAEMERLQGCCAQLESEFSDLVTGYARLLPENTPETSAE